MTTGSGGDAFEGQFASLEAGLRSTEKLSKATASQLKKAIDAARTGQIRELSKVLDQIAETTVELATAASRSLEAWDADTEGRLADSYAAEVVALAHERGLPDARFDQDQIFSYPLLLRVDAANATLRIGKRTERRLRPSFVVELLKTARTKPLERLEPLLQAVEKAYLAITGGRSGDSVLIDRVYELLVLRPGQDREYPVGDFVHDLYRMDRDGPHTTRAGRRLELSGSTTARGGRGHRLVTEDGREKVYSALRFEAPQ